MKEYNKPFLEEELIEIEDIISVSDKDGDDVGDDVEGNV